MRVSFYGRCSVYVKEGPREKYKCAKIKTTSDPLANCRCMCMIGYQNAGERPSTSWKEVGAQQHSSHGGFLLDFGEGATLALGIAMCSNTSGLLMLMITGMVYKKNKSPHRRQRQRQRHGRGDRPRSTSEINREMKAMSPRRSSDGRRYSTIT